MSPEKVNMILVKCIYLFLGCAKPIIVVVVSNLEKRNIFVIQSSFRAGKWSLNVAVTIPLCIVQKLFSKTFYIHTYYKNDQNSKIILFPKNDIILYNTVLNVLTFYLLKLTRLDRALHKTN